mmetsp:Transcript_4762/g.11981  ORF Transcript_4762/g.11981 Transcript_4762/m.11981 type:complete len:213 (+) Transcript_4762:1102-1740(+)
MGSGAPQGIPRHEGEGGGRELHAGPPKTAFGVRGSARATIEGAGGSDHEAGERGVGGEGGERPKSHEGHLRRARAGDEGGAGGGDEAHCGRAGIAISTTAAERIGADETILREGARGARQDHDGSVEYPRRARGEAGGEPDVRVRIEEGARRQRGRAGVGQQVGGIGWGGSGAGGAQGSVWGWRGRDCERGEDDTEHGGRGRANGGGFAGEI